MNRREFIAGLVGATAWPLVARAQQVRTKIARIGWLVTKVIEDNKLLGPCIMTVVLGGIRCGI
jgi:hypothetical protein